LSLGVAIVFGFIADFAIRDIFVGQLGHVREVAVPKNLLGVFLRSPVGAVVFGINNFQLLIGICNVSYKVFTVQKISLQGTPASRHVKHKLVSMSSSCTCGN